MAADRYARSTTGNNANGGTSWVDAKLDVAGLAAIDTAGDRLFLSSVHSESTAAALTYNFAGTAAAPTLILSADDSANPPTALQTGATITTTGASGINIGFGATYWYGCTFNVGTGTTACNFVSNPTLGVNRFDSCAINLLTTAAGSNITLAGNTGTFTEYVNCNFSFANAGQGFSLNGRAVFRGGGISVGSSSPTSGLFKSMGNASSVEMNGFDLSACSSSMNMTNVANQAVHFVMRDCKLPASWTGVIATSVQTGCVYEMYNCDSADTHYRYRRLTQYGSIQDETTLVRTGGANDGVTTFSYKMVSASTAQKPAQYLESPEIVTYIDPTQTGASRTVTISFLHDSATNLRDTEIWVEVMYLGTSGIPLAAFAADAAADLAIATGTDQDSDSASTWTTTGMANPNKQKCVVTFTPQEEGYIHVKVRLAKASYTVYVDPYPVVV